MVRRKILAPVVLFSLALAPTVHAHMAVEGEGQIASGAVHPFVVPIHVLIILGLGLLLGQRVPLDLKIPARVILPVSAVALALSTLRPSAAVYPPLMVGVALCIGILVGLEKKLPRVVLGILCAVAVAGLGLDSGVESSSAAAIAKT